MDEVMKKFCEERIKHYVDDFMSRQKDNLLIQLIGFLEDEKRQLEDKLGSGEVQKMDKYNIFEYREIKNDELPKPDENEAPVNLKISVPEEAFEKANQNTGVKGDTSPIKMNGGLINLTDQPPEMSAPKAEDNP